MSDTNLPLLRRNFHVTLAKKRGLLINGDDLPDDRLRSSDDAVQKHLEWVSFWRRMSSFTKNDN